KISTAVAAQTTGTNANFVLNLIDKGGMHKEISYLADSPLSKVVFANSLRDLLPDTAEFGEPTISIDQSSHTGDIQILRAARLSISESTALFGDNLQAAILGGLKAAAQEAFQNEKQTVRIYLNQRNAVLEKPFLEISSGASLEEAAEKIY